MLNHLLDLLSFIVFIYRIDHLCCIVFELDRGKPPLSTDRYDKFINFLSINYGFRFGSINPQELDSDPRFFFSSDWCISRQLWWGHQIPVWNLTWETCKDEYKSIWIAAANRTRANQKAQRITNSNDYKLYQVLM